MRQVIVGGSGNNLNSTTVEYNSIRPGRARIWNSTEAIRQMLIAVDGTFSRFLVALNGTPGAGNSYEFKLSINGTPGDPSVIIAGTDTTGADYTSITSVSAGDLLSIEATPTSSPTVRDAYWTIEFTPDDFADSALIGGSTDALPTMTSEVWAHVSGGYLWTGAPPVGGFISESNVPTSGTIRDLYVQTTVPPGSGKSYTFDIGSISAVVSNTSTTANDTSNTESLAVNAKPQIRCAPSGTPDAADGFWGFNFQPDDQTVCIVMAGSANDLNDTATEYNFIDGTGMTWNATHDNRRSLIQCSMLTSLLMQLSNRPGTGNSYTFTVMKNGIATDMAVTIGGSDVTGANTTDAVFYDDFDFISLRCIPSSTPTVLDAVWGVTLQTVLPFMNSLTTMGMGA